MANDIQAFYDLTAERTADEWYSTPILLPSIRDYLSLLPQRARILDLGCGAGYESMRLHHEGAEVVGVDFSEEAIRIAKERCPECVFEILDFTELDNRFGTFDGVFASASLIHIGPDKIDDVMGRISAVIKRKGYLLATIQDGTGINESWSNLVVDGVKLCRTVYCYTQSQIGNYAEKNGLRFIREGYLDETLLGYDWRSYIFQKE